MPRALESAVSNVEVVILAAYLSGAHVAAIDTEDIAVLANQLAPGRFSWRKYKEQINLEHVRVALFDGRKPEKGSLIDGNIHDGWMLTKAGVVLANNLKKKIGSRDLSRALKREDKKKHQMWLKRERARMLASPLIARFRAEGAQAISNREAEAFFRIDEYVTGADRVQKLERLMIAFEVDADLSPVVQGLAGRLLAGASDERP